MNKRLLASALKSSDNYYLPNDEFTIEESDGCIIGIHITNYDYDDKLEHITGYDSENKREYIKGHLQGSRRLSFFQTIVKVYVFNLRQSVTQDELHPICPPLGRDKDDRILFHVYKHPVEDTKEWINQFEQFLEMLMKSWTEIKLKDWIIRDNYPELVENKLRTNHKLVVIIGDREIGKTTLAKKLVQLRGYKSCPIVHELDDAVRNDIVIIENLDFIIDIEEINRLTGIIIITTQSKDLFDSAVDRLNQSLLTIELTDIPYIFYSPIRHQRITLP